MNIKVNGITISVENTNVAYDYNTIEKDSIAIENMSNNINKSIEALNIISNIKAVESFGYKSTEAVGENIKQGLANIGQKILALLDKIISTIGNFIQKKVLEVQINLADKKLQSAQGKTECIFDSGKWSKFNKKKEDALALLDSKNEVESTDINSILDVDNLRNTVNSLNAPSSLTQFFEAGSVNGDTANMEEKQKAPISAIQTAVKDAKSRMSGMMDAVKKVRDAATKAKTIVQQPAQTNGADQNADAAEKDKMNKANKLSKICGKVTAVIMSYVSAVTSFDFPKDENTQQTPQPQQQNQQSA